jgi:hypothetical protein
MSTTRADRERQAVPEALVLPLPRRTPAELLVDREAPADHPAQAGGLRAVSLRIEGLVQCQDMVLGELRQALRAAWTAAATGAEVGAHLAGALTILDWSEAVQGDLHDECRRVATGQQPLDLAEVCAAVLQVYSGSAPRPDLVLHGAANLRVWAERRACERLVWLAVELVFARMGGRGSVALEVDEDSAGPWVRIHGRAGSSARVPAVLAAEFRAQADALRAAVAPDESGLGGAGLVLRFPGDVVRPVPGVD